MALQASLHHRADVNDRWIASDQRLGCHLTAAEKDYLGVKAVFAIQPGVLGNPDMDLVVGDCRIADFYFFQFLTVSRTNERSDEQENPSLEHEHRTVTRQKRL